MSGVKQPHGPAAVSASENEFAERIEDAGVPATSVALIKRTWYRTTFFNCSIVAACSFIAPGLWAAMNGLGAGGAASPYYINAANSIIFVLQFVICVFGSSLVSRTGLTAAFSFGTAGFPVYAAALYSECPVE